MTNRPSRPARPRGPSRASEAEPARPAIGVSPRQVPRRSLVFVLALGLALANLAVWGQAVRFKFVNIDDLTLVVNNPAVNGGLTLSGLAWAFSAPRFGNYNPLTWLSHMVDMAIFGRWAGGHHLTSLGFHILATLLLYLVLMRLGAGPVAGAVLCGLFSLHPLRAESVLWVAERKDVLSAAFWMLTLLVYLHYLERPESWRRYALLIATYGAGLMTKPTLVSLPFILVLLDYWPLRRLRTSGERRSLAAGVPQGSAGSAARHDADPPSAQDTAMERPARHGPEKNTAQHGSSAPPGPMIHAGQATPHDQTERSAPRRATEGPGFLALLREKAPMILLAAASGLAAVAGQRAENALAPIDLLPLVPRIENAIVAVPRYLLKILWPAGLAVFYPLDLSIPAWQVLGALVFVAGVTTLALAWASRRPWLLVGWGWYVLSILPVVGLVQVSYHAIADRFTYLPSVGLLIVILGFLREAAPARERVLHGAAAIGAAAAAILAVLGWRQAGTWRNSETLFRHAIEVTGSNFLNEQNLAHALHSQGRHDEAVVHQAISLELRDRADDLTQLGLSRFNSGHVDEAVDIYRRVLEHHPDHSVALCDLGAALASQGKMDEARPLFERALRSNPNYGPALYDLALVEEKAGSIGRALELYRRAVEIDPSNADGEQALGRLLIHEGRLAEAESHLRRALDRRPGDPETRQMLAEIEKRKEPGPARAR